MAALGGSRHALINLSTQIDIPPIIKKSLSPATGYFGHKDEQSHHLNNFLCLRWRNVDLENNTFDVTEQLPFKVPPKTKVIEEMAPPKSNGRKLPITELARPFFLKQLAMQEVQKEQAAKDGKPYYDNDLVVAKPDGAPIAASWVSSQFGKLLEDLDMPHIRFHDLRHTAATNMHQLTGDFYTVGEVLGHTLAGIGASLGLSMNFEAVTARYVDVRLERKKRSFGRLP